MFRSWRLLAPVLLLITSTACIAPKSYVDPAIGSVDRSQITRDTTPHLNLTVRFETNGVEKPKVESMVMDKIKTQLLASGAVKDVEEGASADGPTLKVTLNNVADTGSAAAKGFGTGLTFGLAGSMVKDGYVFTAVLERPGQPQLTRVYNHALYTTIGNHDGPAGLTPMTMGQAFDKVVEDLVLHLVLDLQKEHAI